MLHFFIKHNEKFNIIVIIIIFYLYFKSKFSFGIVKKIESFISIERY